ncbi:alpha/beta hydrolase [Paenibacillus apis]|uniref:Alpha/beta hydrolase n=1 Tax=Paenibacillus apis TaxID=1792174 RepID=A0A919Y8P1_9BACL|nr:alpha/beta hydrolase [Paenibacillus apis]GIO45218.1 alpha/beta hydrolase [Paenibacillus apis]
MIYLLAAGLCVSVILVIGSHYGFRLITQMKHQSSEGIFDYLEHCGVYSREKFKRLEKKEVHTTSIDGLKLGGYLVEPHRNGKRWMILVHGYTVSLYVSTQYIELFQREGFNLLLIDQRRHGKSEGKYTTYGYMEKHDIAAWVAWIVDHYGEDCSIGLHGQSLGGGTVLEYLAIADPHVKFVVADCPYSDLTKLLRHQMSVLNKLPAFPLLGMINRRMHRSAGFRMEQVSPLKAVQNSTLPVLFIHGTEDNYVPTYMSEELYEAKPEPRSLLLVKGAVHGNAYAVDPVRYAREVQQLIQLALKPEAENRSELSGISVSGPVSALPGG